MRVAETASSHGQGLGGGSCQENGEALSRQRAEKSRKRPL